MQASQSQDSQQHKQVTNGTYYTAMISTTNPKAEGSGHPSLHATVAATFRAWSACDCMGTLGANGVSYDTFGVVGSRCARNDRHCLPLLLLVLAVACVPRLVRPTAAPARHP